MMLCIYRTTSLSFNRNHKNQHLEHNPIIVSKSPRYSFFTAQNHMWHCLHRACFVTPFYQDSLPNPLLFPITQLTTEPKQYCFIIARDSAPMMIMMMRTNLHNELSRWNSLWTAAAPLLLLFRGPLSLWVAYESTMPADYLTEPPPIHGPGNINHHPCSSKYVHIVSWGNKHRNIHKHWER